jgi:hypothetical protein
MSKRVRIAVGLLVAAFVAFVGLGVWSITKSTDEDLVVLSIDNKASWAPLYAGASCTYFVHRRVPTMPKDVATELLSFALSKSLGANQGNLSKIAEALAARGADVNAAKKISAFNFPLLHRSIVIGNVDVVRFLLRKGANPKLTITAAEPGAENRPLNGLDALAYANWLRDLTPPPPNLPQIVTLLETGK